MTEARNRSLELKIAVAALVILSLALSIGSSIIVSKQAAEIANLKAEIRRSQDESTREKDELTTIIREFRDNAEKVDMILDRPDGHVMSVDYERSEVRVDINRAMGPRARMRVSVFDSGPAGIATERPKGTIELTEIGDRFSIGRITRTVSPAHPIRIGDIIYAQGCSPNQPTRYALLGKIDINRDGKDDREELERMIQQAGGVVDFDLPPLAIGKETGRLTPRIDWYVIDDRIPLRKGIGGKQPVALLLRQVKLSPWAAEVMRVARRTFRPITKWAIRSQRVGEVIREARLEGIRPMPIERLLNFLGHNTKTP